MFELGNKTTISNLPVTVKTITTSTSGNSSSGHPQHLGMVVLTVTQEGMK